MPPGPGVVGMAALDLWRTDSSPRARIVLPMKYAPMDVLRPLQAHRDFVNDAGTLSMEQVAQLSGVSTADLKGPGALDSHISKFPGVPDPDRSCNHAEQK